MLEDEKRKLLGDSIKALLRYLQKFILPSQALFVPEKDLIGKIDVGKTKCAGI